MTIPHINANVKDMKIIKTYKYRIKDKNKTKVLDLMNRDVKFTWNVINSASRKKWKESRKYFHKYDPYFTNITKGASKELSINAQTLQAVTEQFHKDIRQQKKQLRFKGRKTLGWIPFKGQTIKINNDRIIYDKKHFKVWKSRPFPRESKLKTGNFTCDSLGKWYINFTIEYETKDLKCGTNKVGIDLGMKTTATCSDGKELKLKTLEEIDKKISREQRARNFRRVKALHMYKKNKRKDKICKFARNLVNTNDFIAIGNVSGFTKGRIAKSRYNNSWSLLTSWIKYKSMEYGSTFVITDEYLSTQRCNVCGSIEGPKGIKELCVRHWDCSCGVGHNRDINAAKNILNVALGN